MATLGCKEKRANEVSPASQECQVHLAAPDPKVTEDTLAIQAYQERVLWDRLDVQDHKVP